MGFKVLNRKTSAMMSNTLELIVGWQFTKREVHLKKNWGLNFNKNVQ
jgi:hypothetical protein